MSIKNLLDWLEQKHRRFKKLPAERLANIKEWYKVEITYTSNALEGNTLSRRQTALVLDKNLAVSGKTLNEHLEAVNHGQAFDYIWQLATKSKLANLDSQIIKNIHSLVLDKIDDANAGRWRRIPVRVIGSATIFPNYIKVDSMVKDLVNDLKQSKQHPCLLAAEAHLRLVSIHPFVDGNGRVSRLLMNLLLAQAGWPMVIISQRDRLRYLALLEAAQVEGKTEPFYEFILLAIDRSLDIYLKPSQNLTEVKLLKIGDIARLTQESVATIRYWTNEGLLTPANVSQSGYRLYEPKIVDLVKQIRRLQERRFTLTEIKTKIDK